MEREATTVKPYFRDSPTSDDIHSIDELLEEWLQYIDSE
ncbi:hypothetical protein CASFOL_009405 [Castilleja foliolosa]|uniref:Uncharacterized protein n=1 Tax=Castilleja foliolosa TaxID=1961234 RepID=A0ABD3DYK4_9LAMI